VLACVVEARKIWFIFKEHDTAVDTTSYLVLCFVQLVLSLETLWHACRSRHKNVHMYVCMYVPEGKIKGESCNLGIYQHTYIYDRFAWSFLWLW